MSPARVPFWRRLAVWPTHPCDAEKVASGHRIIEVTVHSEDDIAHLAHGPLSDSDPQVRVYNFHPPPEGHISCGGKCPRRLPVFLVYPSRESILLRNALPRDVVARRRWKTARHREVLPIAALNEDPAELYRRLVRETHFAGIPIANCFMCKYHGGDGIENAVFCKLRKRSCDSNQAASCRHYAPLPSLPACKQRDAENKAYVEQHMLGMFFDRALGIDHHRR